MSRTQITTAATSSACSRLVQKMRAFDAVDSSSAVLARMRSSDAAAGGGGSSRSFIGGALRRDELIPPRRGGGAERGGGGGGKRWAPCIHLQRSPHPAACASRSRPPSPSGALAARQGRDDRTPLALTCSLDRLG